MNDNFASTNSLKFGAYSAICSFVIFLSVYFSGYNPLGESSWLGAWVPLLFIIIGIIKLKRQQYDYLTFKQGFRTGFTITFSAGLLFASMVYIFGSLYAKDLIDMQKIETLDKMEQMKTFFSERFYEELNKNMDEITMGTLVTSDFLSKLLGGTIISLIVSLFLKNNVLPPHTESHPDEN